MQTKMLRLRTLQESDGKLLWEWANDPQVRAASFSSEPMPTQRKLRYQAPGW